MTRVAVYGAPGRMGRAVIRRVVDTPGLSLVAAVGRVGSSSVGVDAGVLAGIPALGLSVEPAGPGCLRDAEVVIDFSLPHGLASLIDQLDGRALVSGVTGAVDAAQLDAAARRSALMFEANFAAGVHVLADVVARAARALPDYDVEVVEAHHRRKVDAPSGTALLLGRAAARARGQDLASVARHGREGHTGVRGAEIGFHAIRGGDVVGEHTVWVAGEGERLLLGHVSTSRDVFANGAVRAAAWLAGKAPGRYRLADALGLTAVR